MFKSPNKSWSKKQKTGIIVFCSVLLAVVLTLSLVLVFRPTRTVIVEIPATASLPTRAEMENWLPGNWHEGIHWDDMISLIAESHPAARPRIMTWDGNPFVVISVSSDMFITRAGLIVWPPNS